MKKGRLFIAALIAVFFAGCYEVNEQIIVQEDGSGTYVTKMDMSQLIDMMQTFAGEEELSKQGLDRPIDTVIAMKSYLDSAGDMTAEQKELLKDGMMSLQMNLKENIFRITTKVPFKDLHSLRLLMSDMGGSTGLSEVFKNVFAKSGQAAETDSMPHADLGSIGSIFDVTVDDGLISRTVDSVKYKALMDNPEMAQVKEMSSSGLEIIYNTTITLPRPVQKTDNDLLKLSDDKKSVTFQYNLLDLLNDPSKYNYRIRY